MKNLADDSKASIVFLLNTIQCQISSPTGYPYDLKQLELHLKAATEGKFFKGKEKRHHILHIDRSKPLNPLHFTGRKDWIIKNDNDPRLVSLSEIVLDKIALIPYLSRKDFLYLRAEKLQAIKEKFIFLDAVVYKHIAEQPEIIPSWWRKLLSGNYARITFDGSTVVSQKGRHYALLFRGQGTHENLKVIGSTRGPYAALGNGGQSTLASWDYYSAVLVPST